MAETEETPQIDETRLQAIRRRIEEVVGDAPPLAKLALEQMVTKHNPDLKGTAGSAGRVGAQSGNVSELTAIANLKPGGADRLFRRGAEGRHAAQHAVRVLRQRHPHPVRHRL